MSNKDKLAYIYKITFPFITEKQKLKLIMYNTNLQKDYNITLINYKFMSRKYKIGEKNGKGKLYNKDGILIFEGDYINGKRNGKGKEYNEEGILIFEGEYLNRKRNGKGKEYDKYSGKLINEGEYSNGNFYNRRFKEFNKINELTFEGEYLNGKRNGKGKEYHYNGNLEFEG